MISTLEINDKRAAQSGLLLEGLRMTIPLPRPSGGPMLSSIPYKALSAWVLMKLPNEPEARGRS